MMDERCTTALCILRVPPDLEVVVVPPQGIVFENLGPRHNLVGAGFSVPLFNFSRKKPPQLRALIAGITRKGNTTRILLCMQKN